MMHFIRSLSPLLVFISVGCGIRTLHWSPVNFVFDQTSGKTTCQANCYEFEEGACAGDRYRLTTAIVAQMTDGTTAPYQAGGVPYKAVSADAAASAVTLLELETALPGPAPTGQMLQLRMDLLNTSRPEEPRVSVTYVLP